ncbi:MAG TPA: hypothetical protein VJ984_00095, partial [Xanthomonadales bacterium]|nr:hypothetical protein [Xanthomonadales bacterium]
NANIQDVFNEHGVQIMSPRYVADTSEPKLVPPSKWYTSPARKPDQLEGSESSARGSHSDSGT